jgi:tetratricopeptide (TPR) repeat protein
VSAQTPAQAIERLRDDALQWIIRGDKSKEDVVREKLQPALALAQQSDDLFEERVLHAWIRRIRGHCEDAEAACTGAIGLATTDASRAYAHFQRSQARVQLGEAGTALADAESALSFDPTNPVYLFARGVAKMEMYRYEDAILDFAACKGRGNPIEIWALSNVALCHYYLGEHSTCFADFLAASRTVVRWDFPPDPGLVNNIGVFYHEFSQDTGDESRDQIAGSLYLQACEARDASHEALYNRGLYCLREYVRSGRREPALLEEARKRFSAAIAASHDTGHHEGSIGASILRALAASCLAAVRVGSADEAKRDVLNFLLEDVDNFIRRARELRDQEKAFYFGSGSGFPRLGNADFLLILRKWDLGSAPSPDLLEGGQGGGFYIRYHGKGIAIDPGPGFLRGIQQEGISLSNVDYVLATHSHISHTRDLEPLVLGLADMAKKWGTAHHVRFLVTNDALVKYGHLMGETNAFSDIELVRPDALLPLERGTPEPHSTVMTLRTLRRLQESPAPSHIGILLTLRDASDDDDEGFTIAYPSHTSYFPALENQLRGKSKKRVDLLILPIGRVTLRELIADQHDLLDVDNRALADALARCRRDMIEILGYKDEREFRTILVGDDPTDEEALTNPLHLGFTGALKLIASIEPRCVILTDFKRELGKLRHRIAEPLRRFVAQVGHDTQILTGDVGLAVRIPKLEIYCAQHAEFERFTAVREVPSRTAADSIAHFCERCTPADIAEYAHQHWKRMATLPAKDEL